MTTYNFSNTQRFPHLTLVHHVQPDGTAWATDKRWILRGDGEHWQRVAQFPFQSPRDFFGWSRPTARPFRSDKCNVYVNQAGQVLGVRGGWVYALRGGRLQPLFALQGDCVLHGGICEDERGWSYVGEYFMNPNRGPVRIWRLDSALEHFEVAHEFPAGSIRHVHGIYRDPYEPSALWVCVGDGPGECHLLHTRDRFQTFDTYGDGSQTWRAVRVFFTPTHVCWLTDSSLESNHACRMERAGGKLEIGQPVDCSGWYGTTTREGLYVTFTTVERGPAILRDESSVLVSEDAFHWEEVFSFKKDFWRPVQVFKYGVISTPSGMMSNNSIWLSGEGLVGLDGASLQCRISKRGEAA